ncbi:MULTISPECIES: gamma carbonic anhydrase family protein [Acidianus]|uniref:Acetyltransferase n=1 Tax=Candidatus Acidianus copahuensis TaxID=1160895 RepID=A0A031LP92_9CREN|nr:MULTISPECIES: acetyltransferase [Acidianus]EZQ06882.1 hypothetical protein CM19_05810 [Candidatus Acidianus copahuensis]NON62851.1 gamma carbonic anhydrase family protein [Acidianus sp. RZ1]
MPIEEYMGKKPRVSEKSYIHPSAYVIGDVEIGEMSSLWPFAVVRGDNDSIEIGRNTNIQENCSVHTDYGLKVFLGDNVTVGHNAVIHGSRVSSNVLVGMGAILLNGSKVGEYSIIGAGAVVTQNTEIPSYSLVLGIPAKVIRKLREEEIEMIEKNALEYVRHVKYIMEGRK